jgi:benzylsuccinate CoA-transferase BbsF subunit
MGNPSWTREAKFSTFIARKNNEDELDERIAAWTRTLSREEVVSKLQELGVPAGIVNDFRDLYQDPQLCHRSHYWEVDHPVLGRRKFESQAFKLSKTPCQLRMPAPLIGQHNEYVCTEILNMTDEEFVELLNEGALE